MDMKGEKLIIEKMLVNYTLDLLRGKDAWGQGIFSVDKENKEVIGNTATKRSLEGAIWKTAEDFVNQWNETGIKCKLYDEVVSMLTNRLLQELRRMNKSDNLREYNNHPDVTQIDIMTLLYSVRTSIDNDFNSRGA